MQTRQRRIPTTGGDAENKPANYHWSQVLPLYEQELADFRKQVAELTGDAVVAQINPLAKANVKVLSNNAETYEVKVGATPFMDRRYRIQSIAPELVGLTGIRHLHEEAKNDRYVPIEFEVDQPVQILVGYFQDTRDMWLQVPSLETDALAAEQGGNEPLIMNAASIEESPAVNIHAIKFGPGRHKLAFRDNGSFIVLGVVPQSADVAKRDAQLKGGS
jgi:hypothetical protein